MHTILVKLKTNWGKWLFLGTSSIFPFSVADSSFLHDFYDMRMSSMYTTIPARFTNRSHIIRWYNSVADTPKGRRVKQKRPNGVVNVVNFWQFLARGVCQNPCFALSKEKTCAPAIFPSTSSLFLWRIGRERTYPPPPINFQSLNA